MPAPRTRHYLGGMKPTRALIATAAIVSVAATLSGCRVAGEDLTGEIVTERRTVDSFDSVELRGVGDILVVDGEEFAVIVTTDSALLAKVTTEVVDGTLIIDEEPGLRGGSYDIDVLVKVPELTAVTLAGAGDISVEQVDAANLTISLSGVGDINAVGTATSVSVTLEGVGDVHALNLDAENVKATLGGVGSIAVAASQTLDAAIGGVGDVTYTGDPTVTSSVSGIGSVGRR